MIGLRAVNPLKCNIFLFPLGCGVLPTKVWGFTDISSPLGTHNTLIFLSLLRQPQAPKWYLDRFNTQGDCVCDSISSKNSIEQSEVASLFEPSDSERRGTHSSAPHVPPQSPRNRGKATKYNARAPRRSASPPDQNARSVVMVLDGLENEIPSNGGSRTKRPVAALRLAPSFRGARSRAFWSGGCAADLGPAGLSGHVRSRCAFRTRPIGGPSPSLRSGFASLRSSDGGRAGKHRHGRTQSRQAWQWRG